MTRQCEHICKNVIIQINTCLELLVDKHPQTVIHQVCASGDGPGSEASEEQEGPPLTPATLSSRSLLRFSLSLFPQLLKRSRATVFSGCHNEASYAGWLQQRKLIFFPQFWRRGVQNKVWKVLFLVRVRFLARGWLHLTASSGACACTCVHVRAGVCVLERTLMLPHRSPTLKISFNSTSLPTPNTAMLGLELQHMNF